MPGGDSSLGDLALLLGTLPTNPAVGLYDDDNDDDYHDDDDDDDDDIDSVLLPQAAIQAWEVWPCCLGPYQRPQQ
jgi:hypothetical protein